MSSRRFEGRVAIVTGGTAGIGLAITERLHAEGAKVVIGARRRALLDEVAGRLGDGVVPVVCDVASESDVDGLAQTAIDRFGRLDIAQANAGIGGLTEIVDMSLEEWQRVVDVTLRGAFLTIKHAARRMTKGGAIVAMSSLNQVQPALGMGHYCASKAGIGMLVQVAAMELGRRGIRVNAVAPGLVETPTNGAIFQIPGVAALYHENSALGTHAQPDDVAKLAAFLASDDASMITGCTYLVDGGAAMKSYPVLPFLKRSGG
jgi:NAD(P)-dependent dehydrogenase (short-subunit alcohol dehydrogenase family)